MPRGKVTTRIELEQVALSRFEADGFDETTVEDIAAAAGVSRRTFFRYHGSKNDVVWGEFDALLEAMASWFRSVGDDVPMADAIAEAVVRFNSLPPDAVAAHRKRMGLILHVPALQAHSTIRYAEWRQVVAAFAARRLGEDVGSLRPQLVGHLALAAAVTAYEQWLADEAQDLGELLRVAFRLTAGSITVATTVQATGGNEGQ